MIIKYIPLQQGLRLVCAVNTIYVYKYKGNRFITINTI